MFKFFPNNFPASFKSLLNEAVSIGRFLSTLDPKLISLVPETPAVDKLSTENLSYAHSQDLELQMSLWYKNEILIQFLQMQFLLFVLFCCK